MTIVVCWKWVSLEGDARWAGVSHADRAALETALVLAEVLGDDVVAVALGPPDADLVLREAIAAGAARGIRIDAPADLRSDAVARALAGAITSTVDGPSWILCGDYSLDRGSGSVPAVLAAQLGAAQALGLVQVDPGSIDPGQIDTGSIDTGSDRHGPDRRAGSARRTSGPSPRRRASRGAQHRCARRALGRGIGGTPAPGAAGSRAGSPQRADHGGPGAASSPRHSERDPALPTESTCPPSAAGRRRARTGPSNHRCRRVGVAR
jgi:electron transfer flavoprotein beta subunit